MAASLLSASILPAAAFESIVANRLGPFETPFQAGVVTSYIRGLVWIATTVAASGTALPRAAPAQVFAWPCTTG
jgi:hypothetical protein